MGVNRVSQATRATAQRDERYVIGADDGTLSGHADVVRVSDRAYSDLRERFRLVANGGGVFSPTEPLPRLPVDLARIARTELLVLDETTTLREFTRELRWNQAYDRLARVPNSTQTCRLASDETGGGLARTPRSDPASTTDDNDV
ncbi:MAG: L-arabinose isomerase [Microbacteriaceae bacterium]|jgi:hypothetical protein|nr:L-arabinose isomerase [Microbacteriaceae bacterium]